MSQQSDGNVVTSRPPRPWWHSIIAAGLAYLVLTYVIPALLLTGFVPRVVISLSRAAAVPVSVAFLLAAPVLYFMQRRRRQRTELPQRLGSIRSLTEQQFERLLAAAFRRQGYVVERRASTVPDDGIHLTVRQDGTVTLVQCMHWREPLVGVEPVRELHSVMTAEQAIGALFVTCGSFTAEAMAFAQSKPIGLIEGPALLDLVQSVQAAQTTVQQTPDPMPTYPDWDSTRSPIAEPGASASGGSMEMPTTSISPMIAKETTHGTQAIGPDSAG